MSGMHSDGGWQYSLGMYLPNQCGQLPAGLPSGTLKLPTKLPQRRLRLPVHGPRQKHGHERSLRCCRHGLRPAGLQDSVHWSVQPLHSPAETLSSPWKYEQVGPFFQIYEIN